MSKPKQQTAPQAPGATGARSVSADALARRLTGMAAAGDRKDPAPVHLWNPPYCGELDIRIARDGLWYYLGTPIGRERLVRLFALVLRRDEDGRHYLVTPVEKIGITVDDAPFVGVDFTISGEGAQRVLTVVNNVGDETPLGPENPLWLKTDSETGEPTPYYLVRGRLEGRIDRKSFYRLVDLGEMAERPEGRRFGVWSQGAFFALAEAGELDGLLEEEESEAGR